MPENTLSKSQKTLVKRCGLRFDELMARRVHGGARRGVQDRTKRPVLMRWTKARTENGWLVGSSRNTFGFSGTSRDPFGCETALENETVCGRKSNSAQYHTAPEMRLASVSVGWQQSSSRRMETSAGASIPMRTVPSDTCADARKFVQPTLSFGLRFQRTLRPMF
jgi:hypothetical protein